MERRALKRIPSDVKTHFFCNDTDYLGTITDISEIGMYIKTDKISFPIESLVNIIIEIKTLLLKVPVKICRLSKSGDVYDGIGVRVLYPVHEYLEYVKTLKSTLNV
jgi:hypothetical protein